MLSLWTAEHLSDHSIKGHPREFFAQKKVIFLVAVSLYLDILIYIYIILYYCICYFLLFVALLMYLNTVYAFDHILISILYNVIVGLLVHSTSILIFTV